MPALSAIARHEYYAELGNSLPPPVLTTPEIRQRRLTTAVEAFEALRPGDAYEARLAVLIVLCGAHAAESLREAGTYREDFAKMMRCHAQAARMMRQERATKRMLAQEQKARLATEQVANTPKARLAAEEVANSPKARPAAASAPPPQAEPQAAAPPVQAAAAAPPTAPAAAAAPPTAPAAAAAPPTAPIATPVGAPAPAGVPPHEAAARSAPPPAAPPSPEAIAKAEAFMQKNIVAAAQIRHDRGVTPKNKAYLRHLTLPSDPALIDALVRGTSDTLILLDDVGGEDLDAAA